MSGKRRWLTWLVVLLIFGCLGGTHWAAYQRGRTAGEHHIGGALMEALSINEDDMLDRDLRYARILARHPGDLSEDERHRFCNEATTAMRVYESHHVPRQRQLGNDPAVERGERRVAELKSLIARITGNGRPEK